MKTYKSFFFKMGILFVVPYFVFTSSACGGDDDVAIEDPCPHIVCVRGDKINCECVCPVGYGGPDCDTEKVPLDMIITAVKVKDFPVTNGTNSWDVGFGETLPDLLLNIHRKDLLGKSTDFVTNAQEGEHSLPLPDGKITMVSPSEKYFFELYDHDLSGDDDLMDVVEMIPYQAGKGFPTTIELKGTKMLVELTVEYKHSN